MENSEILTEEYNAAQSSEPLLSNGNLDGDDSTLHKREEEIGAEVNRDENGDNHRDDMNIVEDINEEAGERITCSGCDVESKGPTSESTCITSTREKATKPQHKQDDACSEVGGTESSTSRDVDVDVVHEEDNVDVDGDVDSIDADGSNGHSSTDESDSDGDGSNSESGDSDGNNQDKGEIPTDEFGRELSAYEVMRLKRIQRNKTYLAQLGLEEEKNIVKESHEKETQQKKKKKKQVVEDIVVERRQSMARKSKTRDVDYSGDLLKKIIQPKPAKAKPRERKKSDKYKSKDDQVPRFIYREFESIKKIRNKNVATAKRLIKLSELECRVAKRNLEIHERREKRKQEREEKRIANEAKMKFVPILNELDKRRGDLKKARNEFDAWQKRASLSSQQLEENFKSVFIDSKTQFPQGIQKNEHELNLMLHERLKPFGEDSNGPKILSNTNKKKKRKHPGEDPKEVTEPVDDSKTPESSNNGNSTSDLTKNANNAGDAPIGAKKANQLTKARNVGGPVTRTLASSVQRKWLEKDVPVPADISTNFVPQAGDIVLYYPSAHHDFLKMHPDIRGKKLRLQLRKPLWERAKEEMDIIKESKNKDVENLSKKAKILLNAKPWYTKEWIQGIDGDAGSYPIFCRVEKVIAEFPYDQETMSQIRRFKYQSTRKTNGENERESTTKIQDKSNDKDKPTRRPVTRNKPSLGLNVTLKPLSTLIPPRRSRRRGHFFEESTLPLPPVFGVLTFPCDKAPFLVPSFLAYRLSLSVSEGDNVKLLQNNGVGQDGIVTSETKTREDFISSALDLFIKILKQDVGADLSTVNRLDNFISKVYDTDSSSTSVNLPEAEFRALIAVALYQCHRRQKHSTQINSSEIDDNGGPSVEGANDIITAQNNCGITNLINWVLMTLPCWKGVKISMEEDKSVYFGSAWDFTTNTKNGDGNQNGILAAALAPSVVITAPSTLNGGWIYNMDQALRLKIERALKAFIEKNDEALTFMSTVTDKHAPEYSHFVPVGMSFRRIQRRLKNHEIKSSKHNSDIEGPFGNHTLEEANCSYYRSVGGLLSDITDIYQNCLLYNDPDSTIVRDALHITTKLKAEITNIEANWATKQREERLQARHAASVASGEEKDSFSLKAIPENKITCENLHECYNSALSREWLMVQNTFTENTQLSSWVPQCGDKILYNRQIHGKFVNGHFSSLTKDQRILPSILPRRRKTKKSDKISEEEGKVVVTDGSDKYQYWLGTILWIKTCFPPLISQELKSFKRDAPILAIGVRFHYQWLSKHVHVVHWRPCELDCRKDNVDGECNGSIAGNNCQGCGLSLNDSFIVPAWVGPMDKSLPPHPISLVKEISVPSGITLGTKNRIYKCLQSLRQRILREAEVDSFTPNQKYQLYSDLEDIPKKFHHIFEEKNSDEGSTAFRESNEGTETQSTISEENIVKLLRRSAFLQSRSILNNEEKKVLTRATKSDGDSIEMYETLMPNPYLCLEIIQKRVKNGHYRHLIAVAHDVREAFVNSTIYILKEKIKAKQIDEITAKKIAFLLVESSVKLNETSNEGDQELITKSEDFSNLPRKVIQLIERISAIRKVHAAALMSISEPIITGIALGLDVEQDGNDDNVKVTGPNDEQIKVKKTLNKILSSLSQDRCNIRKPLAKLSPLPTVQVKIIPPTEKSTSQTLNHVLTEQSSNIDVSLCPNDSIVFKPEEFKNNLALVSALFRPTKKKSVEIKVKMEALSNTRQAKKTITLNPKHYMNNPPLVKALFCPPDQEISVNIHLESLNGKVDEDLQIEDQKCATREVEEVDADNDTKTEADFSKSIVYQPEDYENNDEIIRALFCKPKRRNTCARCRVGKSSLLMCRVRRAHSNLDFVWSDFLINEGGVDGILKKLKPPYVQPGQLGKPRDKETSVHEPCHHLVTEEETSDQVQVCVNVDDAPKESKEDEENSSVSNDVPPHELLRQAEEFLRLSHHSLRVANDELDSKIYLSEEFLKSNDLLDPEDGHYEVCVLCGLGGDVLCCESCPIVSHAKCVGLDEVPDGAWHCRKCTEKSLPECKDTLQDGITTENMEEPDMKKLEELLEDFRTMRQKDKGGSKKDDKQEEDRIGKEVDEDKKDEKKNKKKRNKMFEEKMAEYDDKCEEENRIDDESEGKPNITVGMKFVKRSLFQQIGEIISLPNRDATFYEVRYEDGEVEKVESDDIREGIELYNNLGDTGASSTGRRRVRKQTKRYGIEAPKQPKTRKRPRYNISTSPRQAERKPNGGKKRGRPPKNAKKSPSTTIENLQWSPRAGFVDPTISYYCTVENDTSATIARKVGVEWSDVANEPENIIRFPSLQNKRTRFREGTLVRIPVNYEQKYVIRLQG